MTLSAQAWGHDGKTYTGRDMREDLAQHIGNGLTDYGGFTKGFKATAQGSPSTTLSVAAGRALVVGTGSGIGGAYGVYNDAAMNTGVFQATAGNPRHDILILRVTAGVPALEIVPGTAAGVPLDPAIPGDNYLPIAIVAIPAGTTNITNAMLAAPGGADARVFIGKWSEPWGEVAYTPWAGSTVNGSGATPGDVTGASVSWTAVANRKYNYVVDGHIFSDADNDLVTTLLTDNLNNIKRRWDKVNRNTTLADHFAATHREIGIAAGAVTRKLRFYPKVGGGNATWFADAARAASLQVLDAGPNGNPD